MKTKFYIFALALVSMMATSCSDYLTPENKKTGGQTAADYFNENPQALLTYAYSLMKPVVSRTDLNVKGTDLYMMSHQKAPSQFQNYIFTAENSDVKSYYSQCYACINAANAVLNYDKEGKYTDEAIFVRSYMYYLLTQQFGAVPYVKEYINNSNRSYPRTPLEEVYASLIEDLTKLTSSESLDEENHIGHASKRAAAALLAKVYLAAAWDLGTSVTDAVAGTYSVNDTKGYFAKAAEWADNAIQMGAAHELTMSFEDKWLPSNEGNEEEIFSVQYELAGYPGTVAEGGHGLQNHYGSYFDNPAKTGGKYSDSEDVPTRKAVYMWEKGDSRFEATFMTTWYGYTGDYSKGYFAYYNLDKEAQATLPIWRKYFPWYTTDAEVNAYLAENKERFAAANQNEAPKAYHMTEKMASFTFNAEGTPAKTVSTKDYEATVFEGLDFAPTVKKWDDPNTLQSNANKNCYRDIVLLHLSDLYLVAAEANLLNGQEGKAIDYVNAVRKRAGAAETSFSTYDPEYATGSLQPIDLILDERARELYAEGHRWADLRRTKQLIHYNVAYSYYISEASQMQNNAGEYKWYRPIPQAEINSNDALTDADQNPGY